LEGVKGPTPKQPAKKADAAAKANAPAKVSAAKSSAAKAAPNASAPVKVIAPAKVVAPVKVAAQTNPTANAPANAGPATPPVEPPREKRFHPRITARDDGRSAFKRDRDRVLYSTYFRRLAGITQVVHAGEGHVFHNRMTHSLKVAQVARRLSEYIIKESDPDLVESLGGVDADVAETAGLCHDIGHPPFGHAAEYELQDQFKKLTFPGGFEGNAQSFRIVTKLALRDLESPGLNLTAASLCSILKYPWSRALGDHKKESKKFGFYESEAAEFEHARRFLPTPPDKRQSLEANIMDWSDDVSYAVHDVDDAFRAGLVPFDLLVHNSDEQARFVEWYAEAKIRDGRDELETDPEKDLFEKQARERLHDTRKELATTLIQIVDLFHAPRRPFRNTREDIAHLHHYSSTLLTRYLTVDAEHLQLNTRATGDRLIVPSTLKEQVKMLKKVMVFYVYESPALVAQQVGQRAIIRDLFTSLYEGAKKGIGRGAGLIPDPFLESLRQIHIEKRATLENDCARLAADIICSLTEQQAVEFYRRLTGHYSGTIRDQIVY
jgi:dGTPase